MSVSMNILRLQKETSKDLLLNSLKDIVQRMISRRTKTKLPTTEKLLVPNVSRHVSELITGKRQSAKYYHDKNSKNLPALEQGQPVYVRHQPVEKGTPWDPGTVKHLLND